ncbi:hypothetical protein ABH922_001565 [Rhodococcus sp. 27YEA15]
MASALGGAGWPAYVTACTVAGRAVTQTGWRRRSAGVAAEGSGAA